MPRKRKHNKSKATLEAERSMELLLKKVGFKGASVQRTVNEIPDYRSDRLHSTSDKVPVYGTKKPASVYSGDEILGIVQTHKSNAVPVRKDNKKAAKEAAQMRRN